ncbi:mediator of RNA polymerase II transcription subunit 4-like [Salvia splendens]|nr:mediator of RNA polymerase II transcription subunit 4-like [Salvia splendens]
MTSGVSSILLPLLPPLPRAQSLLLQMASLASKLFEVSPNRPHWLSAFCASLPSFLSSHAQSPTPAQADSDPSSAKEIITQLTALQTQLFEAVAELQEILDLQDAKQKLTRDIRSKDASLLAFANKLKETEHVLDMLVDHYSDYRHPKRTKSVDDADDSSKLRSRLGSNYQICSHMHIKSVTLLAPPEFSVGQGPLRGALPPAPQDKQMRASQLYYFADLDIGLPKTTEGKEKIIDEIIETPAAPPAESNPLASLSAIQGLNPSKLVAPPGWKPGMPVELPIDLSALPPPPPGWKPGDPLPPLDALPLLPRVEEQPRSGPPPGLVKAPEPIQVQHVQLDIEDDNGEDFSSDDASSGSED